MSNDTFNGTNGNDAFNGGIGTDTVTFTGNAAGYRIDTLSDGRVQVVDIDLGNGDTGTDTLTGIDSLSFADKVYALSMTGTPPGETRVSTYVSSNTPGSSAVVMLADGGYLVSWTSGNQDGSGTGIYVQRYSASGSKVGGETRVNTYTDSDQWDSAIAALANGGFVVTWTSDGQDGGGEGVYAQRFDASGNKVGGEVRINNATTSEQSYSEVTGLTDGSYVLTWHSYGASGGVYAQRFDANGNEVGGETLVNTTSGGAYPAISSLSDGGYVAIWLNGGGSYGINLQRFDASGNKAGGETNVTSSPNFMYHMDIATLNSGGYVVVWETDTGGGVSDAIFAQRFDAGGNKVGSESRVDTPQFISGYPSSPAVAALADGGYLIVWDRGNDVYAQRFSSGGSKLGGEVLINTGTLSSQYDPSVTALKDGGFIVTWSSSFNDGIYAQRFDAEGNRWGHAKISGTAGNDVLKGGSGTQVLLGLAGSDNLAGGIGNDVYVLDDNDTITEAAGEGTDTVQASFAYTLGANLEYLVLTGSANVNGRGNASNNLLMGNSGNNILDGLTGTDQMYGGQGNDTYVINDNDAIVEYSNQGTDTVWASISYTLSANIEVLTLVGTAAINGTGSNGNNILNGNSANNVLNGGEGHDMLNGGAGNDTLIGGEGNDVFVVNGGDTVIGGAIYSDTDTVQASISYTLGADIENLTLTGTAHINGAGNSRDNLIIGNAGNNILNGGAGWDELRGGLGNDTYVMADYDDQIVENTGQGVDTIWAGVSFDLGNLPRAPGLENLTLTGAASIHGTGNSVGNVIVGNSGSNILTGAGGSDTLYGGSGNDRLVGDTANDTLSGGAGQDAFRFSRGSGAGVDTILDYRVVDDRIELYDPQLRAAVGKGPLKNDFFRASASGNAADKNDYLIYDTDSGRLYFDTNGNYAGGKVLFAILGTATHPALVASELVVV